MVIETLIIQHGKKLIENIILAVGSININNSEPTANHCLRLLTCVMHADDTKGASTRHTGQYVHFHQKGSDIYIPTPYVGNQRHGSCYESKQNNNNKIWKTTTAQQKVTEFDISIENSSTGLIYQIPTVDCELDIILHSPMNRI